MAHEFDLAKDEINRHKHGFSLSQAAEVEMMAVLPDDRRDYGETRFRAFGYLGDTAVCLVFTTRGENIRAISLRRAHEKEMIRYAFARSRPRPVP